MPYWMALCFCAVAAFAADETVFRGVPTVRVFATTEREDRQQLDAAAGEKSACVIVRRGNKYYWASRDDAPMVRTDEKYFTYFVHAGGGGYVKVFTGERARVNAPADYIEHINRNFETITYWGRVPDTRGAR